MTSPADENTSSDTPGQPHGAQRVLVFGANGPTGQQITKRALAAGHTVTAVTRHPEDFPLHHDRLVVLEGDATDETSVDQAVRRHDAVLSALGVPYSRKPISLYSTSAQHIVAAMRRHDVKRLVVISSTTVDPSAGSQGRFFDHVVEPLLARVIGRTLYADMRRMEALVRTSGLAWTTVRPPGLINADAVGQYKTAETFLPGLIVTRPDLAAFLVSQLEDERFIGKVACVVSPDARRPSLFETVWHEVLKR